MKLSKTDRYNFIQLVAFSILLFFLSCNSYLDGENIAIYTLNYKHGLMENALIGAFYQCTVSLFGLDLKSYVTLQIFIMVFTVIYFLLLMNLFRQVVLRAGDLEDKSKYLVLVIASIVLVSNFGLHKNFGSVDLYLAIITLICLELLMKDKMTWLVLPLAVLGQFIYSGYIIMYFLVLLATMIYLSYKRHGKYKNLILISCATVFSTMTVLHILTGMAESGSRLLDSAEAGQAMLDAIMNSAKDASRLNGPAEIRPDIYGGIVWGGDLWITKKHIIEIFIALVLFAPFIKLGMDFVISLKSKLSKEDARILKVLSVIAVIMMPRALLHSGAGRIVFLILFYICVVVLISMTEGDGAVNKSFEEMTRGFANKKIYGIFLLIYLIMLLPTWGTSINWMTGHIANLINNVFLHIW